jgi:hypothetical protein
MVVVTARTCLRAVERPASSLAGDDAAQTAAREEPSVTPPYSGHARSRSPRTQFCQVVGIPRAFWDSRTPGRVSGRVSGKVSYEERIMICGDEDGTPVDGTPVDGSDGGVRG